MTFPVPIDRIRERLEAVDAAISPLGDCLLAFDRELRYLHWSSGMEAMWRVPAAEVLGRRAPEVFPHLRETGELAYFEAALRGETAVAHERPFHVPGTGRAGVFEGCYSPLRYGPDIVGGLAVLSDVTERKRAAELVRETEQRFQNMADASPVMLWMAGTDSLCTFFNDTWLAFTGRSLEDEWGIGWAEGVYFEDLQRVMDTYEEAFGARRRFEMEYRIRRHDGEYRWILDRGVPRYTPDGTFAGYVGSCTDITERRSLEDELRRAVEARDEFIAIASHELRTPLTPIRIMVQNLLRLVKRGGEAVPQVHTRLEKLDRSVARQVMLLEDLLDLSRLTSGSVPLDRKPLDAAVVVREAAALFAAEAEAARSELRVSAEPAQGWWDRGRLEQVVRNLISNALKYGRGHPVDIALGAADGSVQLLVRDRGIGIAAAAQQRIFERFERAGSPREASGFGLGLWITRKLVDMMGGKIQVESQPGEGATFLVELPRDRTPVESEGEDEG